MAIKVNEVLRLQPGLLVIRQTRFETDQTTCDISCRKKLHDL
jgi:hypothetical protein